MRETYQIWLTRKLRILRANFDSIMPRVGPCLLTVVQVAAVPTSLDDFTHRAIRFGNLPCNRLLAHVPTSALPTSLGTTQ